MCQLALGAGLIQQPSLRRQETLGEVAKLTALKTRLRVSISSVISLLNKLCREDITSYQFIKSAGLCVLLQSHYEVRYFKGEQM